MSKEKSLKVNSKLNAGLPTTPTSIGEEIKMNIFLRYDDIDVKQGLDLKNSSDQEIFTKLRDLKDSF